jgi:SAM-dependent methyltransferase
MFGESLDYYLLRPLTHGRHKQTRQKLEEQAAELQEFEPAKAQARLDKWNQRLGNRFPFQPDLRYLDIGCGLGDLSIAVGIRSGGNVVGIDLIERNILRARANLQRIGIDNVRFDVADVHKWTVPHRFDVVMSHEALEHIHDPREFLYSLSDIVTDGGLAILAFGPLFHSPVGDHMDGFFRCPIPWRGVLFSEKAILRLRTERFRPDDNVDRFEKIDIGLNKMRFSEFVSYVRETRWALELLQINPQLRKIKLAHLCSEALVRIPLVQDYFATSVYAILRKA